MAKNIKIPAGEQIAYIGLCLMTLGSFWFMRVVITRAIVKALNYQQA
jgi:hypothetical protein